MTSPYFWSIVLLLAVHREALCGASLKLVPKKKTAESIHYSLLSVDVPTPVGNNQAESWYLRGSIEGTEINLESFSGILYLKLYHEKKHYKLPCAIDSESKSACELSLLEFQLPQARQALRDLILNKWTAKLFQDDKEIAEYSIEAIDDIERSNIFRISSAGLNGQLTVLGAASECPTRVIVNWRGKKEASVQEITLDFEKNRSCTYSAEDTAGLVLLRTRAQSSPGQLHHAHEFSVNYCKLLFADKTTRIVTANDIR